MSLTQEHPTAQKYLTADDPYEAIHWGPIRQPSREHFSEQEDAGSRKTRFVLSGFTKVGPTPDGRLRGGQRTCANSIVEGRSDITSVIAMSGHGGTLIVHGWFVSGGGNWLAEYSDDPAGVRGFCLHHQIDESHLKTAVDLAKKCFPSAVQLRIEPRQDPEEEAAWLVLRVSVKGGVKDVLKAYDGYVDQWVKLAPPLARGMIRLSYNLVR